MKKNIWPKVIITLLIGLPILYALLGFFLAPVLLKKAVEEKAAGMIGHEITLGKVKINPLEFTLDAENVAVNDPDRGPVLSLQRLFVDFEISSLFMDTIVVAKVVLEQPWINVVLAKNGDLNLAKLAPPPGEKQDEQPPTKQKPLLIESIAIRDASLLFEDLSSEQPIRHIFEPINIELEQVSTRINALGLSEIRIDTEQNEKVLIKSQFSLEPVRLRSQISIDGMSLARINPHLTHKIPVRVSRGRFGMQGRLMMDHNTQGPDSVYFQGGLQLSDVSLIDKTQHPVLEFINLDMPTLDLSLSDQVVDIERIALKGLSLETGVDEQGRPIHFPPASSAESASAAPTKEAQPLKFYLGEFTISDGYIKYDDRSITPAVHQELSNLQVRLGNISNGESDTAQFHVETTVNSTGNVVADGHLRPFAADPDIEMTLALADYDLIKVSPYAGRFIGYEIDRGLLGLDASYKVNGTKLEATHDIKFSNFTLGTDVESPDAIKAPIKLGLSLLTDSQNRITLNLPVEGDLDSPEFSLGSVIRKSFTNLITKLVSSPFSILGNIAGVKADNLDYVGFYPGAAQLTDEEQNKLINISNALKDRPQLILTIHPGVDKNTDMLALKTRRFDMEVEQMTSGKRHGHDPKILKKLYKKQFGSKEYDRKLDSFREKSADLDNPEVRFIEALRQDLIEKQPVEEKMLEELADRRVQNVQDFLLQKAEIAKERVKIGKRKNGDVTEAGIVSNKFSVTSK